VTPNRYPDEQLVGRSAVSVLDKVRSIIN